MSVSVGGPSDAGVLPAERGDLVREVATVLLTRVDALTDDLVARILATEPAYTAVSTVATADLRRSCHANLERIVQCLGGGVPPGIDAYDAPATTGRRRATQGMPLEAVLHSYRLGGRVVWDGVLELAADVRLDPDTAEGPQSWGVPALGPPGDRALLQVAGLVWEVIDRFSAALAEAYRDEELRLRSQHRHQQQRDVAALVAGPTDPVEVRRLGERLGLDDGTPTVAVSVLLDDPDRPLFRVADHLADAGLHAVWALAPTTEIGLVRLDGRDRAALLALLRARGRERVGVSSAYTDLARTREAAHLSALAARALDARGPVAGIEERLPEALVVAAPDVADVLLAETVDRVRADGCDADLLLATVEALLAENGSFTRAARRLYCHRNTVIHRAGRVATASGHDPAGADGRVLWSLALAAHRQREAGRVRGG